MKNKMKIEHINITINLTPVLALYFISQIVKTVNVTVKEAEKGKEVNTEE